MANYTRYSPGDWSTSNMSHYNSADNSRNTSERIRNEAVRLLRDREEKTVLTQRDADRRLGERLHDVTFWRSELQVNDFISMSLSVHQIIQFFQIFHIFESHSQIWIWFDFWKIKSSFVDTLLRRRGPVYRPARLRCGHRLRGSTTLIFFTKINFLLHFSIILKY